MQCFAFQPAVHNPDPSKKSNFEHFEHFENQNGLLEGTHGHRSGRSENKESPGVMTQGFSTGLI